MWASVWGHHHRTMWGSEGEPTGGTRVPASLVNFPAEHEGDSALLLVNWIPAGLSVPVTCLDNQHPSSSVLVTLLTSALVHLASLMWNSPCKSHLFGEEVQSLLAVLMAVWIICEGPRSLCWTVCLALHLQDPSMQWTWTH